MELAHGAAIKATENKAREKKLNADEMKVKKKKQEARRVKMRKKDNIRKQKLKKTVVEARGKAAVK